MTKILVIEDADPLRNDIMDILSFEGYEVLGAENGVVGVDMALIHQPALILCDIMMPELDGYGVLQALRRERETLTIPFIFLTAKTDRGDIRHGMGLGADDYLTKPFIASELLETISARLEKQAIFEELTQNKLQELSTSIITALPHELRTPLNTIIGFSEMLMTEAPRLTSEQVGDWAMHINHAAQRLYRLVENYLMYVRTEVIKHDKEEIAQLQNRILDHPDTLIQFHTMHRAEQENRNDDIDITNIETAPVRISDHDLGKIIEEVVDNAFKFSTPGSKVTITALSKGNDYVIQVIDEGHGMTAEQIESVGTYMQFERWFYEQQGSGLGLVIVRRLVELYGGLFDIQSDLDNGTRITITLRQE